MQASPSSPLRHRWRSLTMGWPYSIIILTLLTSDDGVCVGRRSFALTKAAEYTETGLEAVPPNEIKGLHGLLIYGNISLTPSLLRSDFH